MRSTTRQPPSGPLPVWFSVDAADVDVAAVAGADVGAAADVGASPAAGDVGARRVAPEPVFAGGIVP